MKGIIAWFEQLADDMRFFAYKARNFRHSIEQSKEKTTENEGYNESLFDTSIEPVPLATPMAGDGFFNVASPFNEFNQTIL